MHFFRHPIPAEQHDAQERGFEHERHGPLEPQHVSEEVASRNGENAPVRAELEFHRYARHDAESREEHKEPAPEPGMDVVVPIAAPDPQPLQHNQEQAEAYGHNGPEHVKHDRDGKLQPGKHHGVKQTVHLGSLLAFGCPSGREGYIYFIIR